MLQYAERLPIGLEKVIRTVSADTVKQFYGKWYNLHNMAVIAVGDFSDTQVALCNSYMFLYATKFICGQIFLTMPLSLSVFLWQNVVELIKTHFGDKISTPDPPLIPHFPVPSHKDPRFSCFVESEAAGVSVLWIFHLIMQICTVPYS